MAIDHATFEQWVSRFESEARGDPGGYQRKVVLLGLLGYAYLAALLAVLLALVVGALLSLLVLKALAVKIVIAVGAFVWMILRALWVRIPEPEGRPITRAEAPQLFARIDAVRDAVGAPAFHRVLLTDDFNAAVTQVPALGLFGWHRNFLLLGLPLLQSLTVPQLEAVLAHEAGHLAGGHARVGNWIYRLRAAWSRLHEAVARERHWGSFAVRPFFDWYAPYFAARSFPLARLNEYEADAAAARATAPVAAAEALSAVNVVSAWLAERFWPGILERVSSLPAPDAAPFQSIGRDVARTLAPDEAAGWLSRALARRTTFDDTHPALGDRLAALGEAARLALPQPGESAADALLGPASADIVAQFDARWRAHVGPRWAERHRQLAAARERLAELERAAADGRVLAPAEAIERADLAEEVGGGAPAAIALLDEIAAHTPDLAGVHFRLGRLRLADDTAAAIAHFERAVALDPAAEAAACSHVVNHLRARGLEEEARAWIRRWEGASGTLAAAEAERDRVSLSDTFEPHGLDAAARDRLAGALRAAGARRAWIVRKRLVHFPERALFVIGFEVGSWWQWTSEARITEVQQRIARSSDLPGECLVLSLAGDNATFRRRLAKVAGARVV